MFEMHGRRGIRNWLVMVLLMTSPFCGRLIADGTITGRNAREPTTAEQARIALALNVLACLGQSPNLGGITIGVETTPRNSTLGESDLDTILIPVAALRSRSPAELACVIAHEVEHIQNRRSQSPPGDYDQSTNHNTPAGFCKRVEMAYEDIQRLCAIAAGSCWPVCCERLDGWLDQANKGLQKCNALGGSCASCWSPSVSTCDCLANCEEQ